MRMIHHIIASRIASSLNYAIVIPESNFISKKPKKGDNPPKMKEQRKANKKAEQGFA